MQSQLDETARPATRSYVSVSPSKGSNGGLPMASPGPEGLIDFDEEGGELPMQEAKASLHEIAAVSDSMLLVGLRLPFRLMSLTSSVVDPAPGRLCLHS